VTTPTLESVKQAIVDAGLEVYRSDAGGITLASRVRLHLMDSGVRIDMENAPSVAFTVRSQRSDAPSASPADLFARVRESMSGTANERGFVEVEERVREVTDPVDDTNILDVWHELTFAKQAATLDELIDDVRWALALPKCVD
jgi:hypothetical protein